MRQQQTAHALFPLRGLALALLVGTPALVIALVSASFAVGIDGRPDDVVLVFNAHHIGGPIDRTIAVAMAVVFGSGAVFCLLRFWRQVADWRRES